LERQLRPSLTETEVSRSFFTSYRRFWLDYLLNAFSLEMHGAVVDFGGKRQNKRGSFNPPEDQADTWWYINLELTTKPDIFADVAAVPLPNESADVILCTEVLEHIQHPQICVNEIWRILKPGGLAFVSVPFMYPVHADPFDFQRFTDTGLQTMFGGFRTVEIIPMGGYLGVMGLFTELGLGGIKGQQIHKKMLRRLLTALAHWLYAQDLAANQQPEAWTKFTTGYFLRAAK
jgi:SAM-dependent methyltransferase